VKIKAGVRESGENPGWQEIRLYGEKASDQLHRRKNGQGLDGKIHPEYIYSIL